jgi:hypothetical protein
MVPLSSECGVVGNAMNMVNIAQRRLGNIGMMSCRACRREQLCLIEAST